MYQKSCANLKFVYIAFSMLSIFVISIIFIPNCQAHGSGDYPPSNEGDWVIGNDTYVANETITLKGNLNLRDNASLTLSNVTLLINSSTSDLRGIYVGREGSLNIYDSNVTALSDPYIFNVFGNMTIEHSKISRMYRGITIYSNNVLVANSTIFDNFDYAMICFGAPTIFNNYISSYYSGIVSVGSDGYPKIYNNTITSNGWGIFCLGGSATIAGNHILNNSLDGIYAESYGYYYSHLEVRDNIIAGNNEYGIRGNNATINAINNLIYNNSRWGIYSSAGLIIQKNNTFEKYGIGNGDGNVLQVWYIYIEIFDRENMALDNVNITVSDKTENVAWEGDTISNSRFIPLREYEILNDGTKVVYTPFTIIAAKGTASNSTILELRDNQNLNIVLDFKPDEDQDQTTNGHKKDNKPPLWGLVVVLGIWIFVFIFVIVGLAVAMRGRRRG